MGPTNNLIYIIQHLAGVLSKQSEYLLQHEVGIGFSQYKILMVLEWDPHVQQKAIAESLGQTEASVSRQLQVLESRGLIEMKVDKSNRRKRIITPTIRGKQSTEAAANYLRRCFGPEFATMGELQVSELLQNLQKMHAVVCKGNKIATCDHPLGL